MDTFGRIHILKYSTYIVLFFVIHRPLKEVKFFSPEWSQLYIAFSSLSLLFTGIPITINLNDFLVSTYMHVPCSLGYFECQHVAPNCCCHIRKASITTCLLVAHGQSKLQVSFSTRSTTVPKTQSVHKQIYGLGESFAPDAVTSYKAGTSKLWLLPQSGQARLLRLLSITRQWL